MVDADGEDEDLAAAVAMSLEGQPPPAADQHTSPAVAAATALFHNPPAALQDADSVEVLKRLLGNLLKSPGDARFRRVRLGNAKIGKALSCPGAEALLLAAGFERGDGVLEVPSGRPEGEVGPPVRAALDALGVREPFCLAAQLRAGAPVRCVCALPGGGLATGAMDNAVRVYQPGEWERPALLRGHEQRAGVDGVLAVAPDQRDLVSAGRDGKIILWRDGLEWQKWGVLSGHGEGAGGTNAHVVSCLGRRADGALLSGGWDKTVRAWDGDQQVALLQGHTVAVNAVVGLPSGDVVSGSGDQTINVWRGTERLRTCSLGAPVRALCGCGGGLFASGGNDGRVVVWEASTGRQVAECRAGAGYVLSLAFSPGTGEVAAGSDDGSVAVVALRGSSGSCLSLQVSEVLQHCGEAYGVAFLESGDLAVASGDGSCIVWTRSASRAAPAPVQSEFLAAAGALVAARAAVPAAPPAPASSGVHDMSFPVELGGRKMTLEWSRGEEPQAVARRFLAANDLDPRHAGDVVAFVMHAEQQGPTGASAPAAPGAAGAGKDFNFPVEVADGRRLTISWNRGEDPQAVALNFARQHGGIAADELPDIVAFVQQAGAGAAAASAPATAQQAPGVPVALQQQAVRQVMEMGFDEASATQALQASGWSVEAAVQRLLS